jgi:hypothetical protein
MERFGRTRLVVVGTFALIAAPAMAQREPTPHLDPTHAVAEALGHDHAIAHRNEHATAAHNWTVPVTTAPRTCYEVIGQAQGASRVMVEVHARNARVGDPLSIATSSPTRTRFCAELPGHVYSVVVQAEGPTDWAIAVRAAPADEPTAEPGASARDRLATALANGSSASPGGSSASPTPAPSANYPIGGAEHDFVGTQIRNLASGLATYGMVPAERVTLAENGTHEVALRLVGGHCVLAVAAGVPSLTDVNLEIADPAGNRVAQDSAHHGIESLRYCPSYSGTYRLTVRAFAGFGTTGIQAFEVR